MGGKTNLGLGEGLGDGLGEDLKLGGGWSVVEKTCGDLVDTEVKCCTGARVVNGVGPGVGGGRNLSLMNLDGG